MSGNDEFDDIINGMNDDDTDTEADFETLMEVVSHFWKDFYPGNVFVKGMLIVESVTPDGRTLRYQTSYPISTWEVLGMVETVKQQLQAQETLDAMTISVGDDEDDEDD